MTPRLFAGVFIFKFNSGFKKLNNFIEKDYLGKFHVFCKK